jgi:hypothetical protein
VKQNAVVRYQLPVVVAAIIVAGLLVAVALLRARMEAVSAARHLTKSLVTLQADQLSDIIRVAHRRLQMVSAELALLGEGTRSGHIDVRTLLLRELQALPLVRRQFFAYFFLRLYREGLSEIK